MSRRPMIATALVLFACSLLAAQDDAKLASGPKKDAFVPAPFESYNINGPAKGRPHCLVCSFALSPSVLIFAKEPAEGKDEAFNDLLKQLDDTATEFDFRGFCAGVVILSPDARDSTNNTKEKEAKELIKETVEREKLYERLDGRAKAWKHVVVACFPPEGPKEFKLNPKADVTILFYERLKIADNWAFGPGEMEAKDVAAIMKRVREALPLKKKAKT